MIGILVTGPNASGKTTAVDLAAAPWRSDDRLLVIHADNEKPYKTEPEQVEAAFERAWGEARAVVLVEGTDRPARALGRMLQRVPSLHRQLTTFVTWVGPDAMVAHMDARCAKSGRTFNREYWTRTKCVYEGQRRYLKLADTYFKADNVLIEMDLGYSRQQELVLNIQRRIATCLT